MCFLDFLVHAYIIKNDIFRIGFSSGKNAIFFMVKWAIEFGANIFHRRAFKIGA